MNENMTYAFNIFSDKYFGLFRLNNTNHLFIQICSIIKWIFSGIDGAK